MPYYFFTHNTKLCARATLEPGTIVAVGFNVRANDGLRLLQCHQANLEAGGLDFWSGYVEYAIHDYVWSHALR